MLRMAAAVAALTLVLGLAGPSAVYAEIITVPLADPPDPAGSLPPPTVLRGSPPAAARPVPICPPGYTLSPDYGCVAPTNGDYTDNSPGYDYWPDYGFGYPFGGFSGFDHRADHPRRFARLHDGRGFHGRAAFHGAAKVGTLGVGTARMGGFGRR